jgi:hypothetical protein
MNKQNKITNIVKNNKEGFSVDFNTLKPIKASEDLFCVSLTDNRNSNLKASINKVLFCANMFKPIKNNLVLGGWFDNENNKFCLDLTLLEKDREKALFLAKTFNQKAIFNLKTFETIKNEDYI